MIIPIEIFSLFIGLVMIFTVIGFWKKAPVFILVGGIMLFYLTMTTDSITMESFAIEGTGLLNIPYDIKSFSFERAIFTDTVTDRSIIAEFVSASSSALYNQEINCYEVWIRKTGTPPSSDIIFGVYDVNGVKKYEFGRFSSDLLTTSHMPYKECNTNVSYTTISLDRIGIEYDAGDSTNAPTIRLDALNPYDGVITFEQDYNDVSNTWTSFTANDIMGTISLETDETTSILDNSFIFGSEIKILFALFASLVCLMGVLLFKFKD